ncbi:MAG: sterol desaturase/sphingolipid hydroxylase (fatty acid hydroxylase superfamily) [Glaciecola sp.]|jgi:sterol desaturase/sphingolipid hydroxylase (fatty acid hydroxylase superfamily)
MEYIYSNYPVIFGNVFYGSIICFIIFELLAPHRAYFQGSKVRWINNILLGGLNMLLVRFLLPISAVGIAAYAESETIGLFNKVSLPLCVEFIISFILIDLMGYFLHRASHTYSILWRFHLVHHSDVNVDVSTSVRHHPVEPLISMIFTSIIIMSLGAPLISVIFYEIFRIIISTFSHANIKIPNYIDRILSLVIVTPNFHCIHHAANKHDTNSNYSNALSCWDYLFSTYNSSGQEHFSIGLEYFRSNRDKFIDRLITQPIRYKNNRN